MSGFPFILLSRSGVSFENPLPFFQVQARRKNVSWLLVVVVEDAEDADVRATLLSSGVQDRS